MLEISNYTISGQPLEPGKETKSGEVQNRATKSSQETGKAVATLTGKENASTYDIGDTARLLQQLDAAISQVPVVDASKVATVKAKLRNGTLDAIRNNTASQLESAERIAQKMLALEAALSSSTERG